MKRELIGILTIVALAALAIALIPTVNAQSAGEANETNYTKINCIPEGQSGPVVPGAPECCEGLTRISCDRPDENGNCQGCVGAFVCAKCGNGVCGPGENKCNCPEDCKAGLDIEITNPKDGEIVSGMVRVEASASGPNKLNGMSLKIESGNTGIISFPFVECSEGYGKAPDGSVTYSKTCWQNWDSSAYKGKEVTLTASVKDAQGNKASDSVKVHVKEKLERATIKIINPKDGEIVSGIVRVEASASGPNKLNGMLYRIESGNATGIISFPFVECSEGYGKASDGSVIYSKTCWQNWDSSAYKGKEVTLTASVKDAQGNKASDSVKVHVKEKPAEYATLSVKAYDTDTGKDVPRATTIVLKYIIMYYKQGEVAAGVAGGTASETVVARNATLRAPREIVVGTIKSDGIDEISLEPGTYELITYAKNYAPYTHRLEIQGGKEYNLYAPLSKGNLYTPLSKGWTREKPLPVRAIPVKKGKLIKIEPTIEEEMVEVLPSEKIKKVSIRPIEAGKPGKFLVEAGNVTATTDADIEIEENKLYAKTNTTRAQIKVLPATASKRAREAVGDHKIKDVELKIVDKKPVYVIKGESKRKLIGFIPVVMPIETSVSAETDKVISVNKPWWSSITTEG